MIEKIKVENDLEKPTLNSDLGTLYQAGPEALEKMHAPKLAMTFEQLAAGGKIPIG